MYPFTPPDLAAILTVVAILIIARPWQPHALSWIERYGRFGRTAAVSILLAILWILVMYFVGVPAPGARPEDHTVFRMADAGSDAALNVGIIAFLGEVVAFLVRILRPRKA